MLRFMLTGFVVLVVFGCSANGGGSIRSGMPSGSTCPLNNATQPCACEGQVGAQGRQICSAGAWTACECSTAQASAGAGASTGGSGGPAVDGGAAAAVLEDPAGNVSAARFDWARTIPDGTCVAGHYVGTFDGKYNSPVIFNLPVDVKASPNSLTPGMEFTLVRGTGEIFTVKDGKLKGVAATGLLQINFEADITGTLDCTARKFTGRLENGFYDIATVHYKFEGPISADYDKQTHSFVNGLWSVKEPADTTMVAGGGGTWTAASMP
jgi:hypothetical protein